MGDSNPKRYQTFWIIVIVLLIALGVLWFADPFGEQPPPAAPAGPEATATAPSAQYTTPPAGEGVPVELPETAPGVQPVEQGQ